MRSSTYFNEQARARARAGRLRHQVGTNGESAVDHARVGVGYKNNDSNESGLHRPQHEQNNEEEYFERMRQHINQSPAQPSNASYRALKGLLPPRPTDSFTPETWWIVDRYYRPKLQYGATPLLSRCMRVYGWSENYARRVMTGYRQFLQLKTVAQDWDGRQLEPSVDINRVWEQHIFDVVNYIYDCILLCGHVLGRHLPEDDYLIQGRIERRRQTKKLLENVLSDIDGEIWREVVLSQETDNGDEKEKQQLSEAATEQNTAEEKQDLQREKLGLARTGTRATRKQMTRKERRARSPRQERPLLDVSERKIQSAQQTLLLGYQRPPSHFNSPVHATRPKYTKPIDEPKASKTSALYKRSMEAMSPVSSTRFQTLNRKAEDMSSQERSSTPVTKNTFPPIPKHSAFRAMGGDGRECRLDNPTPRESSTRRLEYEIETDWGVQSFEFDEDELVVDPIDARRQIYRDETEQGEEPFISPLRRRAYHAATVLEDRKPVTIHIRDPIGTVTTSRARRSTKLSRVFAAYAVGKGVKPAQLKFYLNGKLIDSSDTPQSLKLRDHDKIDCVTRYAHAQLNRYSA